MRMIHAMMALFILCATPVVHAQDWDAKNSEKTMLNYPLDNGKGYALRARVPEITQNIKAGDLARAQEQLVALCADYEALFDRSIQQFVFQTREDAIDHAGVTSQPFEWIDWGYKECLQYKMFIAAENKNFDLAIEISKQLTELAPYSAGTATERGYVFNLMKRYPEALQAYTDARNIAQTRPSQRAYLGVALRGAGVTLIDLSRFDEAEEVLLESLKIDPENRIAINELVYIKRLRQRPQSSFKKTPQVTDLP